MHIVKYIVRKQKRSHLQHRTISGGTVCGPVFNGAAINPPIPIPTYWGGVFSVDMAGWRGAVEANS